MASGLTYPYTKYNRLLGTNLDNDLEFSPAPLPPSGTLGGAGRFKYWVDTTDVNNAPLRQCVVTRATAGVYVATEWITLGVIDAPNHKFHFNTDVVDFTGGTSALVVHDLTVTGTLALNTLTVSGATNLNTLAVAGTLTVGGASALHDTSVTGNLTVSGQIAGGTLAISGASALHDTTVTGNETITGALNVAGAITGASLAVSGAISGASLSISGAATLGSLTVTGNTSLNTLQVSGLATLNNVTITGTLTSPVTGSTFSSLHVTGNAQIDGTLAVNGAINGASTITGTTITGSTLASSGAITGASLSVTGAIGGGAITGTTLATTGDITAGTTLTSAGDLHVGGNGQIDGNLHVNGTISSGSTVTIASPMVMPVRFIDLIEGATHNLLITDGLVIFRGDPGAVGGVPPSPWYHVTIQLPSGAPAGLTICVKIGMRQYEHAGGDPGSLIQYFINPPSGGSFEGITSSTPALDGATIPFEYNTVLGIGEAHSFTHENGGNWYISSRHDGG